MTLWIARISWAVLPLTAGQLAADSVAGWSSATGTTAVVLLWLGWIVTLVALFAPRPVGLTALRIIAPTFAVTAVVAAANPRSSTLVVVVGVATTLFAAVFALSRPVARCAIDSNSWGDEQRYPLRIPPALIVSLVPLAVAIVATVIAAVPLLFAAGNGLWALVVLVLGGPAAALLIRSLHSLTRRFLVLVPAGLVISDPITLADPVLFPRERIARVERVDPRAVTMIETLDARAGSLLVTIAVTFTDPASVVIAARGGTAEMIEIRHLLVAPCEPNAFFERARARRLV